MTPRQTVERLFDDTCRRREQLAKAARRLPLTVTSSRGLVSAHPIHGDIARLDRLILRYMRLLGMTPLSRARMKGSSCGKRRPR